MAKRRPDIPVGTDVKLRGREPHGYLVSVDDRRWARVDWRSDPPGPSIVHLDELEATIATRPADIVKLEPHSL